MGDGIHTSMGYHCSDCGKVFLIGYEVFYRGVFRYNICLSCKRFYQEEYYTLKDLIY